MTDTAIAATPEPQGRRVTIDLTPACAAEIDRILGVTNLGTDAAFFLKAITLLRIHVDAAQRGRTVQMIDPNEPSEKFIITLPFEVRK